MAENKISLPCPVCSIESTSTTTTTSSDVLPGANVPTTTSPKGEQAIGKRTTVATVSSTSVHHTYDLTGYQIPIQAEGIVDGTHSPIVVEAITMENPALDAFLFPKRAIHAITVEGMGSSGMSRNQGEETKKAPLEQPITLIFTCPVKQQTFQATLVRKNQADPITIVAVEALSPDNSVLLDVGKQIAADSLKVSSSFCVSMIATSTGAIGVYTALFAIVLPKTCTFNIGYGLLAILPALVFIAAAVGFAYGAFPIHGSFMAADPHSVETYRDSLFRLRMSRLRGSFVLFCVAMVLAVFVVVFIAATHVGCAV